MMDIPSSLRFTPWQWVGSVRPCSNQIQASLNSKSLTWNHLWLEYDPPRKRLKNANANENKPLTSPIILKMPQKCLTGGEFCTLPAPCLKIVFSFHVRDPNVERGIYTRPDNFVAVREAKARHTVKSYEKAIPCLLKVDSEIQIVADAFATGRPS